MDTLRGDGPFTVFAPTDEAFAKLPKGTVEELLKPENKDKLKAILTYHVVSGKVMAADVSKLDGKKVKTVEGSDVEIKVDGDTVTVGAKVTNDIETSNGVIHVIDTVLMPPADKKEEKAATSECRTSFTPSRARYYVVVVMSPVAQSHTRISLRATSRQPMTSRGPDSSLDRLSLTRQGER